MATSGRESAGDSRRTRITVPTIARIDATIAKITGALEARCTLLDDPNHSGSPGDHSATS
jgi:hypothetical protein